MSGSEFAELKRKIAEAGLFEKSWGRTMARCRMPAAGRIIKQSCREKDIEYYETSVIGSYIEILRRMHEVSRYAR